MSSLRLLAVQSLDPRIAAAQALERHADEVSAMLDDLTNREAALRWEARLLREAVEQEREVAAMREEADRVVPMRRRSG
jgi:hypothetical protein